MSVYVGIDIAARSFDMVCRRDGQNQKVMSFEQSPKGFSAAIEQLKKHPVDRIVMEATGVYYLDLAVALHQQGLPVCVINPKSFRHFVALILTGSKTDPVDSALLAEYAQRMEPALWQAPDSSALALRDIGRQINRLVFACTQSKNRLHALMSKQASSSLAIDDEKAGIEMLEQRIERLKQGALNIIADSATLAEQLSCMMAAKGIAQTSALSILCELCVLPENMKAPQVSRHAGLDVRLTQSGSSVSRPSRLSKTGNAYLRSALFMPAMIAVRHDPMARAFYQSLIARGKKKIQAICAVMRKYLTGLWACIRQGKPFDATLLFDQCHLNKA
ncbi:MAG: IS110 family transposase [Methylophaga sp.]